MIFEIKDKTQRKIYLTEERYKHIINHSEMQNRIEEIKTTLTDPLIIKSSKLDKMVKEYYTYFKLKSKFLKVVVKYLNGKGFVITSYFVKNIKWKIK